MLELRQRPRCYDCDFPVSSHADGCDCGIAVLCGDCKDIHERLHQQQPKEPAPLLVDDETVAAWMRSLDERIERKHPGYPNAGYTQGRRAS